MKVRESAVSYRKMMEIRSRFNEADNLAFFHTFLHLSSVHKSLPRATFRVENVLSLTLGYAQGWETVPDLCTVEKTVNLLRIVVLCTLSSTISNIFLPNTLDLLTSQIPLYTFIYSRFQSTSF